MITIILKAERYNEVETTSNVLCKQFFFRIFHADVTEKFVAALKTSKSLRYGKFATGLSILSLPVRDAKTRKAMTDIWLQSLDWKLCVFVVDVAISDMQLNDDLASRSDVVAYNKQPVPQRNRTTNKIVDFRDHFCPDKNALS